MEVQQDQEALEDMENNETFKNILFNYFEQVDYIANLSYIINNLLLLIFAQIIFQQFNKKVSFKYQLTQEDNLSVAFWVIGYYIGVLISIASVTIGPSKGLLVDLEEITIYGIQAIILLNIAMWTMDHLVLSRFSLIKEMLKDKNEGAGIIMGSSAIASGLIIQGAFTGETQTLTLGMSTAFIYWLCGQIILVLATFCYNKMLCYDIGNEIEQDNVAVGIAYSGICIAISSLIGKAIKVEHLYWSDAIFNIIISLILALLLMPLTRLIISRILVGKKKLVSELVNQEKPNIGLGIIEALIYIGIAELLQWCL